MITDKTLGLPRSWKFRAGLVVAGLEAASAVALLATSAYLISRASEQPPILYLMVAVVGVRAFALGRAAFRYVQRLLLHDAVFGQSTKQRPAIFRSIVDITPSPYVKSKAEDLERLTNDVDEMQNLVLRVITPLLQAVTALIVVTYIVGLYFPLAAVAVFGVSLLFLILVVAVTSVTSWRAEGDSIKLRSGIRHQILEYLEHAETLHHYELATERRAAILGISAEITKANKSSAFAQGLGSALLGLFAVTAVVSSSLIAPGYLEAGVPGNLLAVAVLVPLAAFDTFTTVQGASQALARVRAARTRLKGISDAGSTLEYQVESGTKELTDLQSIQLQNLAVGSQETEILSSINLNLEASETVALVGESGIGKTSLAQVICSLRNPLAGQLLINGFPASDYSVESRRKAILLIEQHPHIFAGSIAENLNISGNQDGAQQRAVLERVGLWSQIAERGGLDLVLSEAAGNISGGQAQRLAIARGLLVGARSLVLDEPTSGLDWDNAQNLMALLTELAAQGTMVLIVSHDRQLSRLCDREISVSDWSRKHV